MRKEEKILKKICDLIETTGLTIVDICKQVGVGRCTYYNWRRSDATFNTAIKKALDIRNEHMSDIAEDSLMKKISGYSVTDTKQVKRNIDGRMQVVEVVETTRFIEPETTAIIFLLSNMRPDKWKRNVVDKNVVDDFKEFVLKTSIAKRDEKGSSDTGSADPEKKSTQE